MCFSESGSSKLLLQLPVPMPLYLPSFRESFEIGSSVALRNRQ
jgi:hypothetical protein